MDDERPILAGHNDRPNTSSVSVYSREYHFLLGTPSWYPLSSWRDERQPQKTSAPVPISSASTSSSFVFYIS